jgi:hypothetical protein
MGNAINLDTNGNVYLTGSFSGTADFDPGMGIHNLTSSGDEDIFICKLDGSGNFLWAKSIGGISTDWGTAVIVDNLGHVYTAGLFNETADFDPGVGASSLTSIGGDDIFISKLDNDGNFVWAKAFGGNTGDHVSSIALDINSNVHTTGSFSGTVDFDPGAGTHNLTSNGTEDVFVSKLDANGNFIWAGNFGSTVAYSNDIQMDDGGNIYTIGAFYGVSDFDPGPGTQELTSVGFDDVFVSKLDGSGNLIWAKSMGGVNGDRGHGISVDANGNVHAVGYFAGTGDFDPGAGVSNLTSAGETDIFIVKLNAVSQIHYVKWDATGANNGSSWINAYTDLQSALSAASAGDEIWVAAGTYKPTSGADRSVSFVLKHGVAIYGGFAGTEGLLTDRNIQANVTVLSGDIGAMSDISDNSYHVVRNDGMNTTVLDGFTVMAGNANGSNPDDGGGGLLNEFDGVLTVANSSFTNNAASFGGGIQNYGTLQLSNSTISENSATNNGGGVFNFGPLSILDSMVSNNSATIAGGILNYDLLEISNTTIMNNTAQEGGGITNAAGQLDLENSVVSSNSATYGGGVEAGGTTIDINATTISNNSATQGGGGIGFFAQDVTVTITNSTFSGNSAQGGAGIFANGGLWTLSNNSFFNNSSVSMGDSLGGGVRNNGGVFNVINNTFSGNSATLGGGVYNGNSGTLNLSNTIIANSISSGDCYNSGNISNDINNMIEINNNCGTPASTADPMLGPLTNNGGFTQTMALLPGSPAIDAGDDGVCPETDQRGVTRPQGSHCDIGAYEYIPNQPPTNISLSNNTVDENQPVGTTVGTLSTTDPDAGDTFTYSFCGGTDDGVFSITGSVLKTASVFDFEIKSSYSICIRSTDGGGLSTTKAFTVTVNNLVDTQTFEDVPSTYWAWQFIERLYNAGITGGCSTSPLNYCPESEVTRAQMAVFLERGLHYPASFTAPNVAPTFNDTVGHWAEDWIEALKNDGITSGCAVGSYCPENPVTRAQMAVFLLRAKYGSSYTPPSVGAGTGFEDVPPDHWAAGWIKQLAAEQITGGCGGGDYCPDSPVTRAQMAVFLVRTFSLP